MHPICVADILIAGCQVKFRKMSGATHSDICVLTCSGKCQDNAQTSVHVLSSYTSKSNVWRLSVTEDNRSLRCKRTACRWWCGLDIWVWCVWCAAEVGGSKRKRRCERCTGSDWWPCDYTEEKYAAWPPASSHLSESGSGPHTCGGQWLLVLVSVRPPPPDKAQSALIGQHVHSVVIGQPLPACVYWRKSLLLQTLSFLTLQNVYKHKKPV